jgi:hypothetical protein
VTEKAPPPLPFGAPEYERAFRVFFGEAVHEIARAMDPLLAEIPFEQTPGAIGSVIQDQQGEDVELVSPPIAAEFEMSRNAVVGGDLDGLLLNIDSLASQLSRGLVETMLASLDTVTAATGNVVDASGKPTFEAMIEVLEKIEMTLTEDGELSMPTLVMGPKAMEAMPEPTPAQVARLEKLKKDRLEELLARRRSRRLS